MTLGWTGASLGETTPPDRAARGERVALDCPTDGDRSHGPSWRNRTCGL